MTEFAPSDVAVVIAAWNAEAVVARAVRSALAQAVAELVVVDDGSADRTVEAALAADDGSGRLQVIRCAANRGPSAARNQAIASTSAPWIAILDADDFYQPGRISRLLSFAQDQDFVADGLLRAFEGREQDEALPVWREPAAPHQIGFSEFVLANISRPGAQRQELGFLKPLMRREFLDTHGLRYREDMRLGEDYELYARALACGARYLLTPPQGYVSVVRSQSLSGAHSEEDLQRLRDCDQALARAPGLSDQDRRALKAHYASVDCRLQWRRLISAVKRKRLSDAARTFARPAPVPAYLLMRLAEQAWLRSWRLGRPA